MVELETVVAGDGAWFGGEAKLVENRIHEVAGAIAGERTTGTVGSVSTGSEAKDEDRGALVSKTRYGTGPIDLILVGTTACLGETAAVLAEAGASLTGDDGGTDFVKFSLKLGESGHG